MQGRTICGLSGNVDNARRSDNGEVRAINRKELKAIGVLILLTTVVAMASNIKIGQRSVVNVAFVA